MQTTAASQKFRDQIGVFMGALAVPANTPAGDSPVARGDGVLEFYKNWRVRGTENGSGLYATYSDTDDVIEFGLSERDGECVCNVLHASLALDGDGAELNVMSEVNGDFNFDALITPEKAQPLVSALRFFGEVFSGGEQ